MITLERQSILSSEIAAALCRAEISTAFARITREFGFSYFMLVSRPASDETLLSRIIMESNLPADYVRDFDQMRMLRRCTIAPLLAESVLPICYALDDIEKVGGQAPPPDFVRLQRIHRMTTTMAMALHSIDGSSFRIRMDGTRPRMTQIELNEIGMLILQAFGVYDRIRRSNDGVRTATPLSSRELEVVSWTAQGKTSSEIGQILSLSDHTVNAYMTNAIKKLDCVNRTQLVAKALRLRLIA